jgi:transcription antitermination factor NusG
MKYKDLNYYAVHTKSRHEFVAKRELMAKGIEAYLPSIKRMQRWKDRRKLVEFPLFPGYVFVRIPPNSDKYLGVLKTRGIVAFICLELGTPTVISPEEIAALKLMVDSGKELDVYPNLKTGMRVRVRSGPLRSAEGILAEKEDNYHFVVNVELLGRSIGMRINAEDVEAA